MRNKKLNNYLIYDKSCKFCIGLAHYFEKNWNVKIIGKVFKDVHYVEDKRMYDGVEAIIHILGIKYPSIIKIYSVGVFRFMFKTLYLIVKKLRKYV